MPRGWLPSLSCASATVETYLKVNSGTARLRLKNSSDKLVEINLGPDSPAQWGTLRVTLTSTEYRYYWNGVYQGTGQPVEMPGAWPIMFGVFGGSDVQWDYVVYKSGIYPQP